MTVKILSKKTMNLLNKEKEYYKDELGLLTIYFAFLSLERLTKTTKKNKLQEHRKYIHTYLSKFINDKLVVQNGHNYLNFNNQKITLLSYLRKYYDKYGKSFSIKYEKDKQDVLFIHTLLSFQQLKYIEIKYLTFSAINTFDGYECELDFTKQGVQALNEFKDNIKAKTSIKKIEVLEDKTELKAIVMYINDDYSNPIEFSRGKTSTFLYNLARDKEVPYDRTSFNYIDSNSIHPFYQKHGFIPSKILKQEGNYVKASVPITLMTQKSISQKINKISKSKKLLA